ncbi:ras association domain-containing protein 5 isoform X1 [Cynoglossus semilaevis]|uniref:ras association domain-containing protein 5 isoform X1 n=1 Tax=Cynoglossus semilaevis TaxID=244447 RepID=UPI0007DC9DB3|nr:ras association domain-containing protein 5 isoform X1 [Cynoglossus semilaevis]
MMFRRSSRGSVESTAAGGEPTPPRVGPEPGAEAALRAAEGCRAACHPRSQDRHRAEGNADCDRTSVSGTEEKRSGHSVVCNCDSSGRRSGVSIMLLNGDAHNGAPPQHGRRECRSSGHHSVSSPSSASPSAAVVSSGLPLERVTQGKSGVVRLSRQEPFRLEAWSIFTQEGDPRVKTETGEGHRFEAKPVTQDWCDACSCKITTRAVKCQNCSYTCHLECQHKVRLDCNQRDRETEKSPSPKSSRSSSSDVCCKQNETKEEEEKGTKELSAEEVHTRIEEYNGQVSENGMKLASDGSFTGFIKVQLRLSRPVTVSSVEALGAEEASKPTEVQNQPQSEEQEGTDGVSSEKRTSFYLPSDCVKQLHISSLTTTREVIQGLLKKFMVLDNPQKFALYRRTHRDGQDLFQKLPLSEHPLHLRLIAGPDPQQLSFVLKENETGEVEWHAFSVPELQNFLVILEKEETERVRSVEQKYAAYRRKLQQALQQHDP